MKQSSPSKVALTGFIVAVFVVLAGAAGYMRLLNATSEVAVQPTHTPDTHTLEAPTISKTSDLDKATAALDSAHLSDDLETLSAVADQL